MAPGAERSHVLGIMLAEPEWKLVAVGLAIGLAGSIALARYLKSEVFQVPATDPVALLGVASVVRSSRVLRVPAPGAARQPRALVVLLMLTVPRGLSILVDWLRLAQSTLLGEFLFLFSL